MQLSMLSARGGRGGGATIGDLTTDAVPWVGILVDGDSLRTFEQIVFLARDTR